MWDERRGERVEELQRMTRRDVRGRDELRRTRTRLWIKATLPDRPRDGCPGGEFQHVSLFLWCPWDTSPRRTVTVARHIQRVHVAFEGDYPIAH